MGRVGRKTGFAVALACLMACVGRAAATESTTAGIQWRIMPWGELGTASLHAAPFPDDSRTTGFETSGRLYPREGHYDDNTVAFCVPNGYRKRGTVDLVVVLHGHINTCERFISQSRAGEALERSGRNAIIVVPQGPKDAPDSAGGKLEKPGGFAAFVDEVIMSLKASGRVRRDALPRCVILCGYSGGGGPVGFILRNGDLSSQVREVWLMDAAFREQDGLAKPFATPDGSVSLRSVYTAGVADENTEIMGHISTGAGRFAVFCEDAATTAQAPAAGDRLIAALRRHPVLFVRTPLPHDVKALSNRYLEALLRECRSLPAR